jgi:hypothetical protein
LITKTQAECTKHKSTGNKRAHQAQNVTH